MPKLKQPILKTLKRPKYVDDVELTYELIISGGKGKLSPKAQIMLIKISNEMIKRFTYIDDDIKYDCKMTGLLAMFENWHRFNYERYDKSFPYFSELFKRGIAKGLILITKPIKYSDATFYSVNNLLNI